jgi:hypothetical protein
LYTFALGENFHPEAEAPCNNPCYAESRWLVIFLRTFERGRPPTYRKLGKQDDKLVKTNMTLSGVGTDNSTKSKGVTSVELTIRTKTLAVAIFVTDVEGNYSLIS